MRLMPSVARKTTHCFAASSRCSGRSQRSRSVGYLLPADYPAAGLAPAGLKREPSGLGLPPRKDGSPSPKSGRGRIQLPAEFFLSSRRRFERLSILEGACLAVSRLECCLPDLGKLV